MCVCQGSDQCLCVYSELSSLFNLASSTYSTGMGSTVFSCPNQVLELNINP